MIQNFEKKIDSNQRLVWIHFAAAFFACRTKVY